MARHPNLYFPDGSLTLKAGDGSETIYNVYRGQLQLGSEFFGAMLTLPHPNIPPMGSNDNAREWFQKARQLGLDGTSDELAITFPPQLAATEIETFLKFVFLQTWSDNSPSVETARALLKVSHFLAVDTGIAYAKHHLDERHRLPDIQRLNLGFNYGFADWIKMGFDGLMSVPVNDISEEDEAIMGCHAFRALAKTQLQVTDTRLNLAVRVPVVNHCNECFVHSYCQAEWARMWTSMDGVLGALIKEELPGSLILEKLPTFDCGIMNTECHRRTCDGLKDTLDKVSILKEEEALVDEAIDELLRCAGIPSK
ncbi:hypothetical protein MSAN_02206200 [Mycena sanguinolenta]|uniref:Uncharacterized protein n=1 Tax=Mycena sanguinolenta TaxID=230812 RepID=A0A8H6XDP9_9AGAR|nr:hypothetical protein MSAN_02206200 [Mycena sanguinolenta]